MCGTIPEITDKGIKITSRCTSDPNLFVADSKSDIVFDDVFALGKELEDFRIFEKVTPSQDLGVIKIEFKGKTILLFKTGEVRFNNIENKKTALLLTKMIAALLWISVSPRGFCCVDSPNLEAVQTKLRKMHMEHESLLRVEIP
jgi:hypothetical protein